MEGDMSRGGKGKRRKRESGTGEDVRPNDCLGLRAGWGSTSGGASRSVTVGRLMGLTQVTNGGREGSSLWLGHQSHLMNR